MDIKTLSTIIGHVSSSTTLNVYTHVTDDMKKQAVVSIDQGIAKAEPPATEQTAPQKAMADFQPTKGKYRKHGTGYLGKSKGHRWNGHYTITWPDGSKRTHNVYADTEEECEKLLERMIAEMKAEAAAEKERLKAEIQAS